MVTRKLFKRCLKAPNDSFFLFGPRGVGKSTWIKQNFSDVATIDLLDESIYQRYLADPHHFAQKLNVLKPRSWVVIDEIQRLPNLLNEVHRFSEDRELKFVLSGSSARKVRRAGTNLLAGRALRREMFPLVPEELGDAFDLSRVLESGSLALIWSRNGRRDVLRAYVQTYLREEIQAEALVRNLPGFARFLPVAALFHGKVLNAASLARDAGVARTTILSYLEVLEDTLLAFRLQPYEGRLRVKEKKHPKLHWIDPGVVRAARRQFGAVGEEERGSLFEGFIAMLLRAYQSYEDAFDEMNFWSPTATDALEVDFLIWRGNECVAIEVKSSKRFRPEFTKGLRALRDGMPKQVVRCIVVYLGSEVLRTAENIDVLPFKKFADALCSDKLFQ